MAKRPILEWVKTRLLGNINIAIATGNGKRVAVGNKGPVSLEDNQPITQRRGE